MIKQLSKKDTPMVLELIRNGMNENYLQTTIYSSKKIDAYLGFLIESNYEISGYYYFGYFIDEHLIGFCEWRDVDQETIFLNNIYVDDNYKGLKIGSELISHGFNLAMRLNKRSMKLDVYTTNDRALKWYRKLGFYQTNISYIYSVDGKTSYLKNTFDSFIPNYAQAIALYESFGFTNINVRTKMSNYVVGIPNPFYYKIDSSIDMEDEDLLKILDVTFPNRKAMFTSKEPQMHISNDSINLIGSSISMKKELDSLFL